MESNFVCSVCDGEKPWHLRKAQYSDGSNICAECFCKTEPDTRAAAPADLVEAIDWAISQAKEYNEKELREYKACASQESPLNEEDKKHYLKVAEEIQRNLNLLEGFKAASLTQQPAPSAELVEKLYRWRGKWMQAKGTPTPDSVLPEAAYLIGEAIDALSAGGGVRIKRDVAEWALRVAKKLCAEYETEAKKKSRLIGDSESVKDSAMRAGGLFQFAQELEQFLAQGEG